MLSNSNTNNNNHLTKSAKRTSIGDHLMNLKSSLANFTNFDDEMNYLNKLEIMESNITNIIDHKKSILKRENESKIRQFSQLLENNDLLNKDNNELRNKLIDLENNYKNLHTEFVKCKEMKSEYFNNIIKLRKENTKEFDNKINNLHKQDKTIRNLKKELFLIINILKARVVNADTLTEDRAVKGYIIDIEKNTLKYIEINKNEEGYNNVINYWSAMKELFVGKE